MPMSGEHKKRGRAFAPYPSSVVIRDLSYSSPQMSHASSFVICSYLMAIVAYAYILKRELLLVHGSRSKQGSFNSLLEPRRGDVTGIADLFDSLDFVTNTL